MWINPIPFPSALYKPPPPSIARRSSTLQQIRDTHTDTAAHKSERASMKVEVVETTLVPPSEATPRHALWLSNLDLAVPKTHTPLVYYYPAPAQGSAALGTGSLSLDRLRAALAAALVLFYPLSGRLGVGLDGRLPIECNSKGALFVVANADLTGADAFDDYEPSAEVRKTFVPVAESGDATSSPMAMFQVLIICSRY